MKFRLKSLLLFVCFTALACTALAMGTRPWAIASMTFAVFVILFATALCGVMKGAQRAFCFGFCVLGWGYFAMLHLPEFGPRLSPIDPFGQLLGQLLPWVERDVPVDWSPLEDPAMLTLPPGVETNGDPVKGYTIKLPIRAYYLVIGHMIFTLLTAMVGGFVAQFVYRRTNGVSQSPAGGSSNSTRSK